MTTLEQEPTIAERVEMLHRRARTLHQQRTRLVQQCRAWSAYFHQLEGHAARSFPAEVIANELEAASLGDIKRCGDRLEAIVQHWLLDEAEAGAA